MDPDLKKKILESKDKFDHIQTALHKWKSLIQKREELEYQIEKTREAWDKKKQNDLSLQTQLSFLKTHLRELDNLLDNLEEYTPEKLQEVENEWIANVLTLYPDQQSAYLYMIHAIENSETSVKNLQEIHQLVMNIELLLEETLHMRQRVRKKGILSYIFGVNPNQTISLNLHTVASQIEVLRPLLKNQTGREDTWLFFSQLQKECKNRWGFRKLDDFFLKSSKKIKEFSKEIGEEIKQKLLEHENLLQKKKEWLRELAF